MQDEIIHEQVKVLEDWLDRFFEFYPKPDATGLFWNKKDAIRQLLRKAREVEEEHLTKLYDASPRGEVPEL